MKKKGDYTLYIGDETIGRKIKSIEWKKVNHGSKGGKPLKVFELKYKSAHGEYYDAHIGVIFNFKLEDNITNEVFEYKIKSK